MKIREICAVTQNEQINQLLQKLESYYGYPILLKEGCGEVFFTRFNEETCQFYIEKPEKTPTTPHSIMHELLHIELKTKGWPWYAACIEEVPNHHKDLYMHYCNTFISTVEHGIIWSRLEEIDLLDMTAPDLNHSRFIEQLKDWKRTTCQYMPDDFVDVASCWAVKLFPLFLSPNNDYHKEKAKCICTQSTFLCEALQRAKKMVSSLRAQQWGNGDKFNLVTSVLNISKFPKYFKLIPACCP